jgi:hypothetical protein
MKRWLATVALVGMVSGGQASPWPLQALSSVGDWEASTNGIDWVPAMRVSNPISAPAVVVNQFDAQGQVIGTELLRDANLGSLMWAPNVNGQRPLEVTFRLNFTIDMLGSDLISIWFGADDYAQISLNGHALDSYLLDANKGANRQPILHHLALDRDHGLTTKADPWGDGVGLNTLLIQARDGNAWQAFERGASWVFVDGFNVGEVVDDQVVGLYGRSVMMVDPAQVPEPQGAALVGLALAALVATRARRPQPHRASGA